MTKALNRESHGDGEMLTGRRDVEDVRTLDVTERVKTDGTPASLPTSTRETHGPRVMVKRIRRAAQFTCTPDTAPPQLLCPACDRPLVYRQTVISGVKPIERWDYFACP